MFVREYFNLKDLEMPLLRSSLPEKQNQNKNLICYINNDLTSSPVGELLTFEVNTQISGQKH